MNLLKHLLIHCYIFIKVLSDNMVEAFTHKKLLSYLAWDNWRGHGGSMSTWWSGVCERVGRGHDGIGLEVQY